MKATAVAMEAVIVAVAPVALFIVKSHTENVYIAFSKCAFDHTKVSNVLCVN